MLLTMNYSSNGLMAVTKERREVEEVACDELYVYGPYGHKKEKREVGEVARCQLYVYGPYGHNKRRGEEAEV